MPKPSRPRSQVLWIQVWALALVQGAIALVWVIYNLFLVELLVQAGLPESLALTLLIVENILAVLMEPLMGSVSDQLQHQLGSRFPLIAAGLVLAAVLFLAIPLVAVAGLPGLEKLLLPVIIVWSLAMTIFRSPALALLGQYAFNTQLPQAASILTVVGGLAGAAGPLAANLILSWGPLTAFSLGAAVLLLAAGVLGRLRPERSLFAKAASLNGHHWRQPISWFKLAFVFGAGVGATAGFRLMMQLFPTVLSSRFPGAPVSSVLGLMFVALALTAIPAGTLAMRLGNRVAMTAGLVALALFCGLTGILPSMGAGVVVAIAFGAAFSLVSNGSIPFALSMVPVERQGLGTGAYFGGGALASSLYGMAVPQLDGQVFWLSLFGMVSFLAAAGCVFGSQAQKRAS